MALIKCRECGKDVSSAAPACPHCGAPIATSTVEIKSGLLGQRGTAFGAANLGCAGCLVLIIAILMLATC